MIRGSLLAVALVLVVFAIGVLVAPSFIDWTQHRAQIELWVQRLTGLTVVIEGPVDFALLPRPTLTVHDLRIPASGSAVCPSGAASSGDPSHGSVATDDLAQAATLDLRLALLPLIAGRIQVVHMHLEDPVIRVRGGADGCTNWDGVLARAPARPVSVAASNDEARGTEAPQEGGRQRLLTFHVEALTVTGGQLSYERANGSEPSVLRDIDARFEAEAVAGPFRAEGSTAWDGQPFAFEARVGGETGDRPRAASLVLTSRLGDARFSFSGTMQPGSNALPAVSGRWSARAGRPRELAKALDDARVPVPVPREVSLEGRLAADSDAIALDDVAVTLDASHATGEARFDFHARPHARVRLASRRLDLAAWPATEPPPDFATEASNLLFLLLPPETFDLQMDVTVGTLVVGETVVQDGAGHWHTGAGRSTVETLAATFPGETRATVSGTVAVVAGKPRLEGELLVDASDFRRTSTLAGFDPSWLSVAALRTLVLHGRVRATPEAVALHNVEARVDQSFFTGAMTWQRATPPKLDLTLAFDRLDLDEFLTPGPLRRTDATEEGGGNSGSSLAEWQGGLVLDIGTLKVRGRTLDDVAIRAQTHPGEIDIERASVGDVAGTRASFTAVLDRHADDIVLRRGAGTADIGTLRDLLSVLDVAPPGWLGDHVPLAVMATAQGSLAAPAIKARISLGAVEKPAASLEATGQLVLGGEPAYVGHVNVEASDAGPVASLFGWRAADVVDFVPLKVSAQVDAAVEALTIKDIAASVAATEITGDASVAWSGERPAVQGTLRFADARLAPFWARLTDAFRRPSGDAAAQPLYPGAALAGRWSGEPFALDGLTRLDGTLALEAGRVHLGGFTGDRGRAVFELNDGRLRLAEAEIASGEGLLRLHGDLASAAPARLQLTLESKALPLGPSSPDPPPWSAVLDGTMAVTGAGRSPAALMTDLHGEGMVHVALRREKSGLTSDVPLLLRPWLSLGEAMRGGKAAVPTVDANEDSLDARLSVAEGVLKLSDVAFATAIGTAAASGAVDLASDRVALDGMVSYGEAVANGGSTVTRAFAMEGPIDAVRVALEPPPPPLPAPVPPSDVTESPAAEASEPARPDTPPLDSDLEKRLRRLLDLE